LFSSIKLFSQHGIENQTQIAEQKNMLPTCYTIININNKIEVTFRFLSLGKLLNKFANYFMGVLTK